MNIRHTRRDNLMATEFSLSIDAPAEEANRVCAVAEEFFDEIRRLESLLSHFIEDSEIAQINRLQQGENVIISPETYSCLTICLDAAQQTHGHFNVAYQSELPENETKPFVLLRKPCRVQSLSSSLKIDLGGIGKGFALGHASGILEYYGYTRALLCAGTSTLLALDPPQDAPGWAVAVPRDDKEETLWLTRSAVSCSGKSVRGEHIFDVNEKRYATKIPRGYVQAQTAALADAFSTAIMTMSAIEHHHFKSEVISIWSATQ